MGNIVALQWFQDNKLSISNSIGIDEVGRGPLAGPVVSAAVWISQDLAQKLAALSDEIPVRDSKKLSHLQRVRLIEWIERQELDAVCYGIGEASVAEIDSMNIRNAAFLSMQRAYDSLVKNFKSKSWQIPEIVLVDGNAAPDFSGSEAKTIVKGDSKVFNISIASVIAKEHRDGIMRDLSRQFPQYGWERNVGYGTAEHLAAIKNYGITSYHRKSFAPVKNVVMNKNGNNGTN